MPHAPPAATLSAADLSALSPLWVAVSADLRVEALGPAAARAWGGQEGAPLSALLSLRRPAVAADAAALCGLRLPLVFAWGQTLLQGYGLAQGAGAVLLLTPLVESSAQLRALGLRVQDLCALDSSPTHLMRDQLLRVALADADRFAGALRARNDELEGLRAVAEEARAAAERLAAARADFLATMSHELRTPLNGMEGSLELLGLQPLGAEAAALHRVLARSARGLRAVIDDVLDLAKLEAGRMELQLQPFATEELVSGVVEGFSAAAAQRGLALDATFADGGLRAVGDLRRLRQIANNLVSNALKFTPAGRVRLTAALHADAPGRGLLRLLVDDTGPGVPPAAREAVFDAFRQLDSGPRRRAEGTGLGLSICRRLAGAMGGALVCEEGPLGGARFRLDVPVALVAAPPAPAPSEAAPAAPLARLDGLRVLVVEDNLVNQVVAQGLLESLGAVVTVVGGGLEALDRWAAVDPEVCLMDLMMPELDGVETTRRLRARPDAAGVPILAMTASVLPEDVQVCADAGMDGFLTKPVSRAALSAALSAARAAGRPRAG